jgi:hypothetical protein
MVFLFQPLIKAEINEGLIAYWQFEDNEGSDVIKDYIGQANGTIVNSAGIEYVSGVKGKALNFELADSNAIGWVEYNEVFDFTFESFTVSLWVKADPTIEPGEMMIFKKGSSLTGDNPIPNGNGKWYAISFYGGGAEPNPQIFFGIDDNLLKTEITHPIPDYVPYDWINIVAVRDLDQGYTFLYLDGEEVAYKIDETDDISGVDLPIQIMNYGLAGSNHNKVNGAIDELKIYNRALGADEILSEYEMIKTGVQRSENQLISTFSLSQNYPNPFNPVTTIDFSIDEPSFVCLKVYNIQGKEVEVLANDQYNAGMYTVKWNSQGLPSGLYFYRLETNDQKLTRKMIIQK